MESVWDRLLTFVGLHFLTSEHETTVPASQNEEHECLSTFDSAWCRVSPSKWKPL